MRSSNQFLPPLYGFGISTSDTSRSAPEAALYTEYAYYTWCEEINKLLYIVRTKYYLPRNLQYSA